MEAAYLVCRCGAKKCRGSMLADPKGARKKGKKKKAGKKKKKK